MKTRKLVAAGSVLAMVGLVFACGSDDHLQGGAYPSDPILATGDPTDRSDTGLCDGDVCAEADAPFDGPPLPVNDADIEPTNTCETARVIGTPIAGDTGAETAMTTGTCAEYLSIRVGEEDSSVVGAPMKTKLTLSNMLANFDLYVFFDPNTDDLQCATPYATSVTASTTQESVELTWGEGSVSNGKDDGRTVVVAVVKADGPCGTGSWSLLVEGNK